MTENTRQLRRACCPPRIASILKTFTRIHILTAIAFCHELALLGSQEGNFGAEPDMYSASNCRMVKKEYQKSAVDAVKMVHAKASLAEHSVVGKRTLCSTLSGS